jgi:hypothetical protein
LGAGENSDNFIITKKPYKKIYRRIHKNYAISVEKLNQNIMISGGDTNNPYIFNWKTGKLIR